jgi:polysaccharide biosynthesis transport protein
MSDQPANDKLASARLELAAALDAANDAANDTEPEVTASHSQGVGRGLQPPRRATQPPTNGADHLADTGNDVHLLDYVKVLYKRRWTAGTAFLLVFLGVTVYTFTATPIFEAKTRLLIESDDPNVVSFKQVVDEGGTRTDYYQTQYTILQSRALARKTIETLKAWDSPLLGAGKTESSFSVSALVASVTGLFGTGDEPHKKTESDETADQSRAIDAFLTQLSIAPIRNSRLVDVKFQSTDATLATKAANALAKNYIDQNLEYKFSVSKEATGWLEERLGEQRKQVEAAETALQRYREQNDAISMEDRENIVVQKLADLNTAVTRAKTERIQKEAVYRQLTAIQGTAALDTFPAILGNQYIQQQKAELASLQRQQAQMADKLGERHPEMIRTKSTIEAAHAKLQTEVTKVVQSVKADYQAALAQEQTLSAALDQQKVEALSMNRKAIDYGVLNRDVQSSKQIYDTLLQRAKETGVAGELKTSNIRVVDQAERPRVPVSPRRGLNLLLGVFGGLMIAVGCAFFFNYLDNRIKSPDEIKTHLGLPALGFLPVLPKTLLASGKVLINNGVPPNFAEAFRAIRTNILFSSAAKGSKSIVITSSVPGEGKTMVSSNLAIALAQSGQRVLIIDADMRRPKVHEVFDLPQEPGLSNVLVGNAKASESVKKTSVQGLWYLGAGLIPPNPAELLGSVRFHDFLTSLREHFDWVVIDSPPVMAVTDAVVVSNVASGVLFVIGAEMTSRHVAARALDQLGGANACVVGAVLNRVDIEGNPYYYSHYYRREYAQYYVASQS